MLSSFVMIIAGSVGVAFGPQTSFGTLPSYLIYIVSRFIIACGTRGINVTGFVLGMEMMGPAKRTFAGIVIVYFFALGQVVLVAAAYVNNVLLGNDWRPLAIAFIIPCLPYISYFL
jgi:OCT family organic cation transporter-like MFS transporter 4/5